MISFVGDQVAHVVSLLLIVALLPLFSKQQPAASLPTQMLYAALAYAAMLGLMVFCWVWANSLNEQTANQYVYIRWVRDRMLILSQKAGFILIVGMTSWTFSQMFNLVSL
ncbi:hypothetical protein KFU94_61810 [Chloroflexi bacterium TSY]|nr:hypothetical protein [Chloroflexi bacterium TSY]